jgi:hypothetical protein
MPGRSLKATPSGNDRKPADLNSEEAAVRSRNMAATQNFLDRLRDAGHDPDEVSPAAWEVVAINALAEGGQGSCVYRKPCPFLI